MGSLVDDSLPAGKPGPSSGEGQAPPTNSHGCGSKIRYPKRLALVNGSMVSKTLRSPSSLILTQNLTGWSWKMVQHQHKPSETLVFDNRTLVQNWESTELEQSSKSGAVVCRISLKSQMQGEKFEFP